MKDPTNGELMDALLDVRTYLERGLGGVERGLSGADERFDRLEARSERIESTLHRMERRLDNHSDRILALERGAVG